MEAKTRAALLAKKQIAEKCEGCDRVIDQDGAHVCGVFNDPTYKWSVGACNMATHVKSEVVQQAKMLNPLKASKMAARGLR